MVNLQEVFIVNGIGVCVICFLFLTMAQKHENHFASNRLFITMISITLAGCALEAVSFVVDGKVFPGCVPVNYIVNSMLFIGTVSIGYLWCLYVDLRIYGNPRHVRKKAVWLAAPFIVEIITVLVNLTGCGILFRISPDNVYTRGPLVVLPYVFLFFYFGYSFIISLRSRKNRLYISFFPVTYFITPCIIGTVLQGLYYGISIGWTSVAIAFLFVYVQMQYLDIYVDSLSGLNNRRYLDNILSRLHDMQSTMLFGVMMDMNDFKHINDACGHSAGDRALRGMGCILREVMPSNAVGIRYAGDEFIILIHTDDENSVKDLISDIHRAADEYNAVSNEPFTLSTSIGYCRFSTASPVEDILSAMDEEMYKAKERYYSQFGTDRRKRPAAGKAGD